MKKFIKEHSEELVIAAGIIGCVVVGLGVYKLTRNYDVFYHAVPNKAQDAIDLLICGVDKKGNIVKDVLVSFDAGEAQCVMAEMTDAYSVLYPA